MTTGMAGGSQGSLVQGSGNTRCLCAPHCGWQRPEQGAMVRVGQAGGSLPLFLL